MPVFERAKTVHAFDNAAAVIGDWSVRAIFPSATEFEVLILRNVEDRKMSFPRRESSPDSSVAQPIVAIPTELT
jgi:hypothetical protein